MKIHFSGEQVRHASSLLLDKTEKVNLLLETLLKH